MNENRPAIMRKKDRKQTASTAGGAIFVLRRASAILSYCAVGLLVLMGGNRGLYAAQNGAIEHEVKAAFLYNFARFTQWPQSAFPAAAAPISFCLFDDPFRGALDEIVRGETIDRRLLTVRRVGGSDNLDDCHILYLGPPEAARTAQILSMVENAPVLTVGEAPDFIDAGGMIQFRRIENRIRFEINLAAVERTSLRLSSQLLRVADIVGD